MAAATTPSSEPTSPEQFLAQMKAFADNDDVEERHIELDKLMCRMLIELGYGDGVTVFRQVVKYYS